jgi:hypothetical protein
MGLKFVGVSLITDRECFAGQQATAGSFPLPLLVSFARIEG